MCGGVGWRGGIQGGLSESSGSEGSGVPGGMRGCGLFAKALGIELRVARDKGRNCGDYEREDECLENTDGVNLR